MSDITATNQNLVSKDSLPPAAQHWLEKALPANYVPPASIKLEQEGSMDIRNGWTPFTASGVYTGSPLSFHWQARFKMGTGFWFLAEDGHKDGKGWGGAKLWGLIPMGKRTDPEVHSSQVVRNLGELPWFPGYVLTDTNLQWKDLNESTFEASYNTEVGVHTVRFELNSSGDVIRAYSPARVYDVQSGYAEAPWYYEFTDHQEFDGVWMPGSALGTFERSEGPWEYIRVKVNSVSSISMP